MYGAWTVTFHVIHNATMTIGPAETMDAFSDSAEGAMLAVIHAGFAVISEGFTYAVIGAQPAVGHPLNNGAGVIGTPVGVNK